MTRAWTRDREGLWVVMEQDEDGTWTASDPGPVEACQNCGDDVATHVLALCLDCVESLRGGA